MSPPILLSLAALAPLSHVAFTEAPDFLALVRELGSFGVLVYLCIWGVRKGSKLLSSVVESQQSIATAVKETSAAQGRATQELVDEFKTSAREMAEQHRAILASSERIRAACELRACELLAEKGQK